jgi:hypothetical protein
MTLYVNYTRIPCTQIDFTPEGVKQFNKLLHYVYNLPDMHPIHRTPRKGISNAGNDRYYFRYDVRELASMVELTLIYDFKCWRIQLRNKVPKGCKEAMGGKIAFRQLSRICKNYGINLDNYKITNGLEVKETITPYIKKILDHNYIGIDMENVHHIDFNSSFMSNLAEAYPEFRPVAEYLYNNRNEHPEYKGVMNCSIGYMQSRYIDAELANLSKAAIDGNNKKIMELVEELRLNNRIPLLINTDGVWYTGDIYHGLNEGNNIGQWKHDHINCTLLVKSPAAYQYKDEFGNVKTVMSGQTYLDRYKPRDLWEWGDIFKSDCEEIQFKMNNKGYIVNI